MLELCISGKRTLYGAGPGPIVLEAGNQAAGYYGRLDHLFTLGELQDALGDVMLSNQSNLYDAVEWRKGIYENKTIYFPAKPITQLSWNELYSAGLVFGEVGEGPSQLVDPTPQDRYVSMEDGGKVWYFKVRLAKYGDPYVSTPSTRDIVPEDDELGGVIVPALGYGAARFDEPVAGTFGPAWTQGHLDYTVKYQYSLGTSNTLVPGDSSVLSGWAPVLELVTDVLPLVSAKSIKTELLVHSPPKILAATAEPNAGSEIDRLVRLANVHTPSTQYPDTYVSEISTQDGLKKTSGVSYSMTFESIAPSLTPIDTLFLPAYMGYQNTDFNAVSITFESV